MHFLFFLAILLAMNKTPKTGILIAHIGTPSAPTPSAVRCYLQEFLSDRRVVELPRILWWPILYGIILPFRSKNSAKLYQKIWTEKGSPLLVFSKQIADQLQKKLSIPVELGMHYNTPSIPEALEKLRAQHVTKIIILPLYPQYSATTTASTFDLVANTLKYWRNVPDIHFVSQYADHSLYIDAIC